MLGEIQYFKHHPTLLVQKYHPDVCFLGNYYIANTSFIPGIKMAAKEANISKEKETERSKFNIPDKVKKYEDFINNNLMQDLSKVHTQREKLYSIIADYMQLKDTIVKIKTDFNGGKMKTQVDIGCNFYCQAEVKDTRMILVAVGYGFYVEFTLEEALDFIHDKISHLTKQVEKLTKDSSKIKANVKLAMEGLKEIQMLTVKAKKLK